MKRIILSTIIAIATLATMSSCSKETFTVTFNSEGGSAVASQQITGGEHAFRPGNPIRGNLVFLGWFSEPAGNTREASVEWNFSKNVISSDTTLHARWERDRTDALMQLETLIKRAGTLESSGFTADSWAPFLEVLGAAKYVATDPDSNADQLAETVYALETAVYELRSVRSAHNAM
ncbi:MAG: InlB B-repeat-containing protein [Alistipes sp.]|jgi:hypothetical protein|nr:InlB B-repeat-containing protein [Alistipes sp.]